ncbi:hypothetical protein EV1_045410 [Malus domestica]
MQLPFLESMLDAELIVTISFLFSVQFEFLCRVTAYLCAVKLCIFSNSVIDLVVDEIQNLQYFQWMHHKAIEEASTD